MPLLILDDPLAVAEAAAALVGEKISSAVEERDIASLVLSGGSTPSAMFRLLAQPPYLDAFPWSSLHLFWADERLVAPDDPGSNFGQAQELLLQHVPIPDKNQHRMRGELLPQSAAADYTEQLWTWQQAHDSPAPHPWPRFDLVLLGLGGDGHTASLFPDSPPDEQRPVVAVTAGYDGRPSHRITLTPPVFNDARAVAFLVTGSSKSAALAGTLQGDHDPRRWPAQRIQPVGGDPDWLVDAAAAELLST